MYEVSENFLNKVYADDTKHLLKIYIDGQEVEGKYILSFKKTMELFSNDEFTFGSTPAQEIEVKIHKDGLPKSYKEIYVETGIENEIVPIGHFYLEDIKKDDNYTVTLKALDRMVKFEFNYDGSTLFSESKKSATLLEVLNDICLKAGVELGSASFLNMDKEIAVYDSTVTARTYLSYIAEQAGGFACIGRDNKLYIKQFHNETIEIPFRLFQKFTWGENFYLGKIAYEDGVQNYKIGKDIISVRDVDIDTVRNINEMLIASLKDMNTVWINNENMYIVDEEQVRNIYELYKTFHCYSFKGTTIINPAIDIGDIVLIDGKKVIYQGSMEYVRKFKADISSTIQCKSKEENMSTKVSDIVKIRRVESTINQIEGRITLLAEEQTTSNHRISQFEVSLDGIRTQVSQNTTNIANIGSSAVSQALEAVEEDLDIKLADYVTETNVETLIETKAGQIETSITANIEAQLDDYVLTTDMEHHVTESINNYNRTITETYATKSNVEDLEETVSSNTASISANATAIALKLDSSSFTSSAVISLINNKGSSVAKISADSVDLSGLVTINSLKSGGSTQIDGSRITTGTISADRINFGTVLNNYVLAPDNTVSQMLTFSGGIKVNCNSTANGVELFGQKPYIDFHYNNSTADYTHRIIALNSTLIGNYLRFDCKGISIGAGDYIRLNYSGTSSNNPTYLGINSDELRIVSNLSDTNYNSVRAYTFIAYNGADTTKILHSGSNTIIACTTACNIRSSSNTNTWLPLYASKVIGTNGSNYSSLYTSGSTAIIGCPSGGASFRAYSNVNEFMDVTGKSFTNNSSRRYKKNIVGMTDEEAEKILNINIVNFDYKYEVNGTNCKGVIAEEVYPIIPSVVTLKEIDGEILPDGVDYSKFVPYLIKEIQILQKELEEVKNSERN